MNKVQIEQLARQAIAYGAMQKQSELVEFILWLREVKPVNIFEIGTLRGGMLWLYEQIATGVCVGIDMGREADIAAQRFCLNVIHGDSHKESTKKLLLERYPDVEWDVLFIDGDHSYAGVKQDYEMYGDLAKHVAFHDICDHTLKHIDIGVRQFWKEIKRWNSREITYEPLHWGGIGIL